MAAIRLLRSAANLRLSVFTLPKARNSTYFGYTPNFGKLNFSQFLIPEFGLGKFGTMLDVAHKTRRRTRQFIGVDFVIHQQAFASLVTVDLWSQSCAGPHVSRLT